MLKNGKLTIADDKPVLVMYTAADEVLKGTDIDKYSDYLTSERKDGAGRAMDKGGLVEREIGTDDQDQSAHDVLAAPSVLRVDEAWDHMESWMTSHFDEDWQQEGGK
jgi:hypothetical protein